MSYDTTDYGTRYRYITMKLELANFPVERITLGDTPRYADGELCVDAEEVRSRMFNEAYFEEVRVHVAHPGDSTRIIHIVDVVEPRYKDAGSGHIFPGVLGPPLQVGNGRTARMSGMTVMTTSSPAAGEGYYWREAIVDMSAPGALYSPFSGKTHLVLEITPRVPGPEVSAEDLEMINTIRGSAYSQRLNMALRKAQLEVAAYVSEMVSGCDPTSVETYALTKVDSTLPRVVYCCQVMGEFVYGESIGWQPTLLHPNEMMDGAIYRPFNTPGSVRTTIYHHQNNPLINDLYRRHGKDLNFLGVLLVPAGPEKLTEKELGTGYATKLLQMLKADGVVISWMGGGHLAVDPMLLIRNCERAGISATLLSPEMARTTDDTGFVYFAPEAEAITSTGNYEEEIVLPPVDRVIGGDSIFVTGDEPSKSFTTRVTQILGSTQTFGMGNLTGTAY